IQFGGNTCSQAGTYVNPLNTVLGCDSTITLILTVESCSGAGIFDSQVENIKIYPIPSHGEFFVEVPIAIVGNSWVIEDMTGREVMVGKFENKTMKFTLKDQINGTYFIRIEGYGVERLMRID
ncbi:MAG: T9SS type A sorting domain-containing protein, partial [Bacteroidetes bacterium]|nr:T9SS type A sorting domain-containing protein [Bacteroidota bacterium]